MLSAAEGGGRVTVCRTAEEAVDGADVVYADSWMSYGIARPHGASFCLRAGIKERERERAQRRSATHTALDRVETALWFPFKAFSFSFSPSHARFI